MSHPLIGVFPLWDPKKESYWMLPGYLDSVTAAGGLPLMLPLTADPARLEQLAETLDGFVFTGGQDIDPALYHQPRHPGCGDPCPGRDAMEARLFPLVEARRKPILGICRGLQILNVLRGGTLYQDLPAQHPSEVCHRQAPPYDRPSHTVQILADTPLARLLKTEALPVNSCHHQAIQAPAPGLLPMALSPDGLIEAVCDPAYPFLWAVQWHPEFSYRTDEASRKIFAEFLAHC